MAIQEPVIRNRTETAMGSYYQGQRSATGATVTVDGRPLDPARHVRDFGAPAFEWGYEGSGPSQLALALLVDFMGAEAAQQHYRTLLKTLIAEIDVDDWQLSADDIRDKIAASTVVPITLDGLIRQIKGE